MVEAVRTSVDPKVIDCPNPNTGRTTIDGVAKDGIQVKVRARVTVRAAQELPKHSAVRLSAAIGDVHLFAGPWPGRRMG